MTTANFAPLLARAVLDTSISAALGHQGWRSTCRHCGRTVLGKTNVNSEIQHRVGCPVLVAPRAVGNSDDAIARATESA